MKLEGYKDGTEGLTTLGVKEPDLFKIVMHNDDFTPMEFVVGLLERFFSMGRREAADIMLQAHMTGRAVWGAFTKDVAETKAAQVTDYAKLHEHPLICSTEAV